MSSVSTRGGRRSRTAIRTVGILALAAACAIPLYYVVVSSFKGSVDMTVNPLGLPKQWTLQNYSDAFADGTIWRAFANSLIVTVAAVLLQVLIGSMAAYGVILKRTKFTVTVGAILMVAFAIPVQSTLLPLYKMESATGLVNTLGGLIILYMGSAVFCYYLIVGYMRSLPFELFEAAKLDGAGAFQIYYKIVLPLIRPILATVIVFQTVGTWNDFLLPSVFLSSTSNQTIVLQVYNAVQQFSTNWPLFMTITVIALVPVVIFFVFCQRWIVSGLTAGSVKG